MGLQDSQCRVSPNVSQSTAFSAIIRVSLAMIRVSAARPALQEVNLDQFLSLSAI
jgi:hypothetical protein